MRVLLSRHGKACLEIGGNAVIKFLTVSSMCPIFDSMPRSAFFKEYNTLSKMTELDALLSFVGVSKRAFKHNPEVCNFLRSQIMGQNFSEMTADELLFVYNKLARSLNKQERKAFSSKSEAIRAIEKLDNLVVAPTATQLKREGGNIMSEVKLDDNGNEVAVVPAEKKTRGKGIGKRAMELILEGKTNQEIIEIIKAEIAEANPTVATMAWYRNKLRQDGLLPKPVRKAKKEAAPEAEAEAEAETEEQDAEAVAE